MECGAGLFCKENPVGILIARNLGNEEAVAQSVVRTED